MESSNLTASSIRTEKMDEAMQKRYQLTITADNVVSTDDRFTMDNLFAGDNFKPLDALFINAAGDEIRRHFAKGERKRTNQTLPKLACQLYESQLVKMSKDEKEAFPICKYSSKSQTIYGIYSGVEEYRRHRNTIEYLVYNYADDRQLVLYCWNVFSTIFFVQECLKRFGNPGDQFVLIYRDKTIKELDAKKNDVISEELPKGKEKYQSYGYANPYSKLC